jgi:hypothetical protein
LIQEVLELVPGQRGQAALLSAAGGSPTRGSGGKRDDSHKLTGRSRLGRHHAPGRLSTLERDAALQHEVDVVAGRAGLVENFTGGAALFQHHPGKRRQVVLV